MLAMLVPLSIGFSASAERQKVTNVTTSFKDNVKAGTNTDMYADGELFLVNINNDFWAEKHGLIPSQGAPANYANQLPTYAGTANPAEYVYDQSVLNVYNLPWITTTAVDVKSKNAQKGRLYGIKASQLYRFMFVERDKAHAYNYTSTSATQNDHYYSPFKYNDNTGMISSNDKGYREWSAQPEYYKPDGLPDRCYGTKYWKIALGESNLLDNIDKSNFTGPTAYGIIPFTHDCKNSIMRTHFIYINQPDLRNDGEQGGSYTKTWRSYHYTGAVSGTLKSTAEKDKSKVTYYNPYTSQDYDFTPVINTTDGHTSDNCPICNGTGTGFENQTIPAGKKNLVDYYTLNVWGYNEHKKDFSYPAIDIVNTYGDKTETITVPSGTFDPMLFEAEVGAPLNDQIVLVFVPSRYDADGKYIGDGSSGIYSDSNNNLKVTYQPYMQLYLADWDKNATKDSPDPDTKYWKHDLKWYTSVDDKISRDDSQTGFKAKQIFELWGERLDTHERKLIAGTNTETGAVHYKDNATYSWPIAEQTYWVHYTLTCKIPGLQDVEYQITYDLPVPKENGEDLILDVKTFSTPVDNRDTWNQGKNSIDHTLIVSRDAKNTPDGPYLVQRWNPEGGEDHQGAFETVKDENGNDVKFSFKEKESKAQIKLTVECAYDDTRYDNYRVVLASDQTKMSNEKEALSLSANIAVQPLINDAIGAGKYYYIDNVEFTDISVQLGTYEYIARDGDTWNTTRTEWNEFKRTGSYIFENYIQSEITEPTFHYIGYIVTPDNGTWGIGYAQSPHTEVISSLSTTKVYPHNQVLDVKMEEGGQHTDPIWNYPTTDGSQKATTKQIFPGVDFDIRAARLYRHKNQKVSYDVAFGLIIYDKNGNRVGICEDGITEEGKQYFQKWKSDTQTTGVHTPQFDEKVTIDDGNELIYTQNVMFDFCDANGPYHYDAFVYYVRPNKTYDGTGDEPESERGKVVHYSHSGYKLLHPDKDPVTGVAPTVLENYYGSTEYALRLPIVDPENNECEPVVINNTVSGGDAVLEYKQLAATYYDKKTENETLSTPVPVGPVRATQFYEGKPGERYDGFAYMVLDLDQAIPNSFLKVDGSRSKNLLQAVTSYKIRAQQGNTNIPGQKINEGLRLFYPTIGDGIKGSTDFSINSYNAGAEKKFDGLKPGLDWNTGSETTELHVYGDVTTKESGIDIVEGIRNTGETATSQMKSDGNNCVLIGLRFIDKMRMDGKWTREPKTTQTEQSRAARKGGAPKDDTDLKNDITIFIEPQYTVASFTKPIFSYGPNYTGVTEEVEENTEGVSLASENQKVTYTVNYKSDATGTPGNSIPTRNPNVTDKTKWGWDYIANKVTEGILDLLGREKSHTYNMTGDGVVSGVNDVKGENVKVFADGRDIVVEGAEGEVIVFNAYGQSVYAGHSSRIAMAQPGVYLVAANGSIYKVFVK